MANRIRLQPPADIPKESLHGRFLRQLCELLNVDKHGDFPTGSYSIFEDDGTLVMTGNATVYNDINMSVNVLNPGATAPGTWTIPGTALVIRAFTGTAAEQSAHGSLEILHDYKEGTDIVPHLHWCPTTTGAGNVKWQLEYSWLNGGSTVTTSVTTSVTVAAPGVIGQEQRTSFPAISGVGKTIGSRFVFRLFRNPADAADTYGADAGAFDIGIHYEIDTIGSRQITTK